MIKRLKYVSHFARPMSESDLAELSDECTQGNLEHGITGVLMVSGEVFFQVLEGAPDKVDLIYEKIRHDPRHRDVVMLADESANERLFPDWTMQMVSLDVSRRERLEPLHAILETIVEQQQLIVRLAGALERAVWQELIHGAARAEAKEKPTIYEL